MFYKFNFIKICFLVICIIFSFMFLLSPNEVFAMEPDFVTNYYGVKEYVGTDAYLYFHPDLAPDIDTIQSKTSTLYGTLIEDDWYANKKYTDYMHSTNSIPNKYSNLYHRIKRVSFYYLWKIHSSEYIGYKDFEKSWDTSSSIRKEILKYIKSDLNKYRNK